VWEFLPDECSAHGTTSEVTATGVSTFSMLQNNNPWKMSWFSQGIHGSAFFPFGFFANHPPGPGRDIAAYSRKKKSFFFSHI
jgi:hypothetical protein